ncbi:MAG: Hpt domain-containing protein [Steroidobacter sp.]
MKRLYEQGEVRYTDSPPLELLNNLLYYVARARSSGARVAAVRASFRLTELLPVDHHIEEARESLSAPSVKLMKTVAAAIKEDLGRVKDALDIFVRQGGTQVDELAPQLELLKKIGDTLGVLGLGELRDKVQTETTDLQSIVTQRSPASEGALLRMAATLIKVEDSLDEQLVGMILPSSGEAGEAPSKPAGPDEIEFRQVTEAVLRECIVNMARIKEAIAHSVEKPRETQAIDQIPQLMRGITAGLLMLGKTRVAEIMEGIDRALAQFVRSDGMTLAQDAVDRLADAIVAVEYYMETLQAGRTDPWYMLDNAETCLQFLAEAQPVPRVEAFEADAQDHARTVVIEPMSMSTTVAAPTEHERTAVLDRSAPKTPVAPATQSTVAPAVAKAKDREIDPEFLELFIEEAKDEIAKLKELFPRWDANPQDQDALVNVRRSFHTLKGSGRMVGAQLIGDFAWSVENLLNRVINKTLERTPDMMSVLRDAVAAVPELVEQLETGRNPAIDVGRIIARGNEIAGVRNVPAAPGAPRRAPEPPVLTTPAVQGSKPAEKKTAPSPVAPPMDPTLHDIYAKETAGHLATIREFIAACDLASAPYPVTDDLHRSCHTLSGTAKTAGARQGIKIAEPLNRYIRKLHDNSVGMSAVGLNALKDSVAAIQQVVDHISEDTGFFLNHGLIVVRLVELEQALDVEISRLAETLDAATAGDATMESAALSVTHVVDDFAEEAHIEIILEDSTSATDVFSANEFASALGSTQSLPGDDPEVIELEPTDASTLAMMNWSFDNFPASGAAAESAAPAHNGSEGETSADETIESIVYEAPDADSDIAVDEISDIDAAHELEITQRSLSRLDDTLQPTEMIVETAAWAAEFEPQVLPARSAADEADDAVVQRASASDESETVESVAFSPLPAVDEPAADEITNLLETPAESEPEYEPESVPAPAMAAAPAAFAPPPAVAEEAADDDADFDPEVAAIFTEEAAELLETADQSLSAWRQDRGNSALVFELKRVVHTLKGGARMAGIRAMGDLTHELETFMQLVEGGQVPADQVVFDALQASLDELHRMRDVVNQGGRCAPARELMNRIRALAGLESAEESTPAVTPSPAPEISHASPLGNEPIEVEYPLETVASSDTDLVPTLTEFFEPPAQAADEEVDFDVEFGADELGAAAPREAVRLEEPAAATTPAEHSTLDVASLSPELPPDAAEEVASEPQAPALPGREPQAQERQEFARVDADLLDTLLNNAGEVSIFRSRLEQQVGSIEFNLAELGRTVTRLKDQLRKLELETEAQILHRHEEEHPGRADFDPLELDRYSTIQQLSRAFAESVSDVSSIEGLLENLTREAQNLLLQQSRVVTEMQNGLMRTRMVPFQRHVQRLSRLVRQVAADTDKRAELVVVGASGELDRQVLERMLPPFEHMLRNSVVHGIETSQERVARGKPESGTIRVGLHREGSEMVIVLEDDGRGIDVNAVRERAKARGLLQPGRVLSDEEALQLILEPGFSTASTVTQHAGRGVGMDVVVNEIKKLGGALFTASQPGQGVKFTIRLPFTLAITQALIVRTGEELYALPLPSVEGVARVPRSEVQKHLSEESPTFTYGGQIYRFQHLGAFVGGEPSVLPEVDVSIPVILIRAGEHSTAVVTDELVGSREMVVKSVGPQIASIRGIAGATILGDGRIVIILDMGALVRSEWRGRSLEAQGPKQDKRTFALVVDDSITVRRVTQRLLERNGMRVMTAKDGVDALSILQEHLPDVILLDIEMPRMDGYELASHVRADARMADIPIVMITSRSGEKHRARAIELGVNDYLGKPYQENQLLDAIEPLVDARRRKVS